MATQTAQSDNGSDNKYKVDFRSKFKIELKGKDRYEYFFGKDSPFSQHHLCKFTVNDVTFNCTEQYMMYSKAVLFKDDGMTKAILKTDKPVEMKRFGRKVKNFDGVKWTEKSTEIVREGNMAKFSENDHLRKQLYNTYPKIMVEASPRDRLWGIGMSAKNEKAWDASTWRGKNRLGFILTEVRDDLMKDDGLID